ncbi:methionine synthase [Aeromicrobium sp. IC_218]|uniref:methionine synthase n=1 Tax=Aeromicrobium sp. IC_218 TaxID=2545468 RepID=UPI00103E85AA|nr:methionine synthase [Aeromicrobium sp. IC_218]TCI95650.1 methionine synthase [Aeromicrobium sp. IC_218]
MALATGIGSMPGTDVVDTVHTVLGEVGALPHVPELPARGAPAGMVGRSLALLVGVGADLQPQGWRLTDHDGVDLRRARSLLARDLDAVEELAGEHRGPFKTQVTGPLTLAATVERPKGDKLLADHGARRELAESMAEGVAEHVRGLRRRLPHAELVVQVDEPALVATLEAKVPTASGWATHRKVDAPEADALLRRYVDAIAGAGARPVVHTCAPDVPVALLRGAGFQALAFDLALAHPHDAWAEAFEAGVDLWPGAVPAVEQPGSDAVLGRRLETFFDRLGFARDAYDERLVVTPACGLAGVSPTAARRALALARTLAEASADER